MSPYRMLTNDLGLTHESGPSNSSDWLYLFLTAMADQDETLGPASVTYSDPAKEVLHRLTNYRGFAVQRLREQITTRVK